MRRTLFAFALILLLAPAALAQPQAEEALARAGFVEPAASDAGLVLDMRYATADNFTHQPVYPSGRCFLRADIARRLLAVQAALKKQGLGLKVYDCYRPFSVQQRFWALVPDERYVARPEMKGGKISVGSKHNRGAAVDVGLVDAKGRELPMPTGFDDFTDKAHRDSRDWTAAARASGLTLERAMQDQGFEPLPTEWWHFDGPGWQGYELLDAPIN